MRIVQDMYRLGMAAWLMAMVYILMSFAIPVQAAEKLQDLEQLDILVAAAMGAEIGEPGGARAPVDRRLKLKACPETPRISGPEMGAAAVRCDAIGWRIRVPLLASESASNNNRQNNAAPQSRGRGEMAVRRGEQILLTVERPGFTLTRVMIADRDGQPGDVIPVRAEPRDKPIYVRVTDTGKATIL